MSLRAEYEEWKMANEKKLNLDLAALTKLREEVAYHQNKFQHMTTSNVTGLSVAKLVKLEVQAAFTQKRLQEAQEAYARALGRFVDTHGDAGAMMLFGVDENGEPIDEANGPGLQDS